MTTNATINQLESALSLINKNYEGNISFATLDQKTKNRVSFTLAAKSGMKGSRRSWSGRRLPKASWHVHGHLFDALFNIDPAIFIISMGKRITKDSGNWLDKNIGTNHQPMMFSETSIEETEDLTISDKTRYVSTDGWRGYSEPINAICGANDTGMWSDSPCPSTTRETELNAIKELLRADGIGYRQIVTETSNVFCVHVYILVKRKDRTRALSIVETYINKNYTRLLYAVNNDHKKAIK